MTTPRLQIDLTKIHHNAGVLVHRLKQRGIETTGITKAFLGLPSIGQTMLDAGVVSLGDARIENIEAMRCRYLPAEMVLIRSPMLSQIDRVVAFADVSFNTELAVIAKLSSAAGAIGRRHAVILMVELGDLREGIMPENLSNIVLETLRLPNIVLKGIGTNLACRNGVAPDAQNMAVLSGLAEAVESEYRIALGIVTGGNSSNLEWAFNAPQIGRVNNLRLGESILLGRDPLHRKSIRGLYTDAITLVAEVIEAKVKPSMAWGEIGCRTFGTTAATIVEGQICQAILAVGHQDVEASGLQPPVGVEIIGASSDHLVVKSTIGRPLIGTEFKFQLNYSALLRAMTSPFVSKDVFSSICDEKTRQAVSRFDDSDRYNVGLPL